MRTVRAWLTSAGALVGLSGVALASVVPSEPMVSPGSASAAVVIGAVGLLVREARGLVGELGKWTPTVHLVHHRPPAQAPP